VKYEWGGGLSFHAFESNAFIEAEENFSGDRSVVYAFLPLPNIDLLGVYAPTSKWSFSGRLNWFGIKWGDGKYKGVLWDVEPKVSFEFTNNFGISCSYRYLSISEKVEKENWDGRVKMRFQGPTIGIHSSF